MRVRIISHSENLLDTVYTAARTCYNAGSPIDMWEDINSVSEEDKVKLIRACLNSGHASVIEHGTITIALEGVSRALTHQWVRSRLCVHSQQSQRYVGIKEDISILEGKHHSSDNYLEQEEIIGILDKYFVWEHESYAQFHALTTSLYCYLFMIKNGAKAEDARSVLPNCTKSNIVTTMNLRELIHVCNERLCARTQTEYKQVMKEIVKQVVSIYPWLEPYLQPKCIQLGYCPEAHGSCGRKPKKKEIIK